MYNKAKDKTIIFLSILIIVALTLGAISYKNYSLVENKISTQNIDNILDNIEDNLDYIYKISLEYASFDDTYNFIKDKNKSYIFKNFREGSYTLENLGINYFILIDANNNITYSKYTKDMLDVNTKLFEEMLINKNKKETKIKSITQIMDSSYFLVKVPVHKSDYNSKSNGYLYVGSIINNEKLKELSENSISSNLIEYKYKKEENTKTQKTKNFPKIVINTSKKEDLYSNNIYFYHDSEIVLGFNIKTESIILDEAVTMISSFMIIILIFIITLTYTYIKYKRKIREHENLVETKVEAKTNQIKIAMMELEKVNLKLYDIAHTDFLTKTMNRRNFFIHAQNVFSIAKKNNQNFAAIMIDIDKFKSINDRFGHDIGDKVLVTFTNVIKENIDEEDILGRLGGEEFALVLPNTTIEEATKKATMLKEKVELCEITILDNSLSITASFGVSDNKNCNNIDEMLNKADKLLYNAKNSGRNVVRSRLNLC